MFKWILLTGLAVPNLVAASDYVGIVNQDAAMAYNLAHQGLDPRLPATWTISTPPPAGPYQEVQSHYINERSVLNLVGQVPIIPNSTELIASPISNTPNESVDPNAIPYGY